MESDQQTQAFDMFQQGPEAWNAWREETGFPRVSLPEVNLRGRDLCGYDLKWMNFYWLDFSYANLTGADLAVSTLNGSDFTGASMCDAHLVDASFASATLAGTDLRRTEMSKVLFRKADLTGAEMAGALLSETLFIDSDLSNAVGLTECTFAGPSTVDHRTIGKSAPIPKEFLTGCGIPPDLAAHLIETVRGDGPPSCFISYATDDQDFADRLHRDLVGAGFPCWYAPIDLSAGEQIREGIERAIQTHDRLIVVLSRSSAASPWVHSEVEAALERERLEQRPILVPVRLDDSPFSSETSWVAEIRRKHHIADFTSNTHSYRESLRRLIRDLRHT